MQVGTCKGEGSESRVSPPRPGPWGRSCQAPACAAHNPTHPFVTPLPKRSILVVCFVSKEISTRSRVGGA